MKNGVYGDRFSDSFLLGCHARTPGLVGNVEIENMQLDDLLGIDVFDGDAKEMKNVGRGEKPKRREQRLMKVDDEVEELVASSSSDDDGELEMNKADLENLQKSDPEFYNYLKDADRELLEFDEEDSDENGEDVPSEDDRDEEQTEPASAEYEKNVIDSKSLDSWCDTAEKKASLGAVKFVIRVYRVACHHGDGDDADEQMQLASSAVYNKILLFVLKKIDTIFRKSLGIEEKKDDVEVHKLPRWPKVEPFVRSYLGNTLHLLGALYYL